MGKYEEMTSKQIQQLSGEDAFEFLILSAERANSITALKYILITCESEDITDTQKYRISKAVAERLIHLTLAE